MNTEYNGENCDAKPDMQSDNSCPGTPTKDDAQIRENHVFQQAELSKELQVGIFCFNYIFLYFLGIRMFYKTHYLPIALIKGMRFDKEHLFDN